MRPFQDIIVGLARQPLVNSYARTLPLVWKMGWAPVPEGPLKTELPPLPIEILKEKDVLDEFVKRVNLIGKVWLPVPDLSCVGFFFPTTVTILVLSGQVFVSLVSHTLLIASYLIVSILSPTLLILYHSFVSLVSRALCGFCFIQLPL